jgi:hypothetical protein
VDLVLRGGRRDTVPERIDQRVERDDTPPGEQERVTEPAVTESATTGSAGGESPAQRVGG